MQTEASALEGQSDIYLPLEATTRLHYNILDMVEKAWGYTRSMGLTLGGFT